MLKNFKKRFFTKGRLHNIFATLFIAYFFLVTAAMSIMHVVSSTQTVRNFARHSKKTIFQLSQAIDSTFYSLNSAIALIAIDYQVGNYMDFIASYDFASALRVDSFFENFYATNNYVHSVYVYYHEQNAVYAPLNGIYALDDFHDATFVKHAINSLKDARGVSNRDVADTRNNYENVITLVNPIPLYASNPQSLVVMNVKSTFFTDYISIISADDETEVYVLNDSDEIVISTSQDFQNTQFLVDAIKFAPDGDAIEIYKNNTKMLASYIESDTNGWKYFVCTPYANAMRTVMTFSWFVLAFWLLLIVACIYVSAKYAQNFFTPLKSIANMFSDFEVEECDDDDIYENIKFNITNLVDKFMSIQEEFDTYRPVLRDNFLNGLLSGTDDEEDEIFRKAEYFNVKFEPGDFFCVCIFRLNTVAKNNEYEYKQISMLTVYAMRIMETYLSENSIKGEVFSGKEGTINIILSASQDSEMTETAQSMHCFITKACGNRVKIVIGVGTVVNNVTDVPYSDFKAQKALQISDKVAERQMNTQNKNSDIIKRTLEYIQDHFTEDISLDILAKNAFLSPAYLSKLFKAETEVNIKDYINNLRIENAKHFLSDSQYAVRDVGIKVGYENVHSFIKIFKKYTGMTPSEYRNTIKEYKESN